MGKSRLLSYRQSFGRPSLARLSPFSAFSHTLSRMRTDTAIHAALSRSQGFRFGAQNANSPYQATPLEGARLGEESDARYLVGGRNGNGRGKAFSFYLSSPPQY